METILDTDSARIVHEPGQQPTAVVAFAGVGNSSVKVQKPEFVETLGSIEADCHAFYVIDAKRSWYNDTAGAVVDALRPRLSPLSQTITLGNSMGGFGALYFAGQLPHCTRAIAFAPQFSVAPGFIPLLDNRWVNYTSRMQRHALSHAMQAAAGHIDYVIFFGADDVADLLHAQRFMKFPDLSVTIFYVETCGHDVAGFIKGKDGLPRLVDRLIARRPDPDEIQDLLGSIGVSAGYWSSRQN